MPEAAALNPASEQADEEPAAALMSSPVAAHRRASARYLAAAAAATTANTAAVQASAEVVRVADGTTLVVAGQGADRDRKWWQAGGPEDWQVRESKSRLS